MRKAKTRKHKPEDVERLVNELKVSPRHARRLLSEHGLAYALEYAALQRHKVLLQIERLQLEHRRFLESHVRADIVEQQTQRCLCVIRESLGWLSATLPERLVGLRSQEMAKVISDCVHECLQRMARA